MDNTQNLNNTANESSKTNEMEEKKLTNKDIRQAYTRWWMAHETMRTYERGIGPAFFYGMYPLLKKIYGDNKEQLSEAVKRSLNFFNGQFSWCGTILGVTASLEEERKKELDANNGEEDDSKDNTVTGNMVETTKVALFGPLAGIGDSITNGTIHYIFIALFLPLAMSGNWLGAVLPGIIFVIYSYVEGQLFTNLGYRLGRNAATELLSGGAMKDWIDGLSLLGMFMTGVIGASFVSLESQLSLELQGQAWALQDILDGILPGILPLAVIMGVYFYFEKKGLKPLNAILWVTLIVGGLAVVGIL